MLLVEKEEIGEEGKEEVGVSRRASPGGPNSNMSSSEEKGAEKLDQSNGVEASNKKKEINDKYAPGLTVETERRREEVFILQTCFYSFWLVEREAKGFRGEERVLFTWEKGTRVSQC